MWYFYKKFQNDNLENLINQINAIFGSIFTHEAYEYQPWMEEIKLKADFEEFRAVYELSTEGEKEKLGSAFEHNIQIESICNLEVEPVTYSDLLLNVSQEFTRCIEKLKCIQDYLYDNLLKLKGLEDSVGTLKSYYDEFYDSAIEYVCPFCGLGTMLTSKDDFREAFDHYLPRSKYPFVSLLRENLFPICHTCNSTYKGDADPRIFGRFFYPFTTKPNDCELKFSIVAGVIEHTDIVSDLFTDEIQTWDELLDIKDRITNFADININGWVSNVQEAMRNYNVEYEFAISTEIKGCTPEMQDHKFVKKAVLKAL